MLECICGSCRSALVKRQNRSKGTWFYGCSSYPKCIQTYPIETRFTEFGEPMPYWDDGEVTEWDMGLDDIGDRR